MPSSFTPIDPTTVQPQQPITSSGASQSSVINANSIVQNSGFFTANVLTIYTKGAMLRAANSATYDFIYLAIANGALGSNLNDTAKWKVVGQISAIVGNQNVNLSHYTDLAQIGATVSTPINTILSSMNSGSRLSAEIAGGSLSVYPIASGILTLDKISGSKFVGFFYDTTNNRKYSALLSAGTTFSAWALDDFIKIGEIRFMPFRSGELPHGWHYCNNTTHNAGTAQYDALNSLSSNFKTDWKISGIGNLNVPNLFYTDGRGLFFRSSSGAIGTNNITFDSAPNITGGVFGNPSTINASTSQFLTDALPVAVAQNSALFVTQTHIGTNIANAGGSNTVPNDISIDASRSNIAYGRNGTSEINPIFNGMTPSIFLGV